jgi:hypothetical protein
VQHADTIYFSDTAEDGGEEADAETTFLANRGTLKKVPPDAQDADAPDPKTARGQ